MKNNSKKYFCFPSEFAAARLEAGFSLRDCAAMCCRSTRTLMDWEAGKQPVPAWALRLVILESRLMDALYGLQTERGARAGFALGGTRTTLSANDGKTKYGNDHLKAVR